MINLSIENQVKVISLKNNIKTGNSTSSLCSRGGKL
jgi:hypothetical protein